MSWTWGEVNNFSPGVLEAEGGEIGGLYRELFLNVKETVGISTRDVGKTDKNKKNALEKRTKPAKYCCINGQNMAYYD